MALFIFCNPTSGSIVTTSSIAISSSVQAGHVVELKGVLSARRDTLLCDGPRALVITGNPSVVWRFVKIQRIQREAD